jgi:hypothetical protein
MMTNGSSSGAHDASVHAIIPGEYEPMNSPHDRSGAMSGPAYGSDDQPPGPNPMDADTIREREKEGGGALRERRAH